MDQSDGLIDECKHVNYKTMFRIVRLEEERARDIKIEHPLVLFAEKVLGWKVR